MNSVSSSVHGDERRSFYICLLMVYCITVGKVCFHFFLCTCIKNYFFVFTCRWDMSVDENVYTNVKARTLKKM